MGKNESDGWSGAGWVGMGGCWQQQEPPAGVAAPVWLEHLPAGKECWCFFT